MESPEPFATPRGIAERQMAIPNALRFVRLKTWRIAFRTLADREDAIRIAKVSLVCTDGIEHHAEQIVQWSVLREFEYVPSSETFTATSR